MNTEEIIQKTEAYVKKELEGEGSGHDWWHIYRVWNMARKIAEAEKANLFVVELAALLHDIADRKLNKGNEKMGLQRVKRFLTTIQVEPAIIIQVLQIIETYSYTAHLKTGKKKMETIEGAVVQDADRLDAIGAIGIARAFSYGGHVGRVFYDPTVPPRKKVDADAYARHPSPTINHFYEKLLLLKDLMNTDTAKKIAEKRHKYMEEFLKEFMHEWEGHYD
jgi:uncharacterized protein